MYSMLLVIIYVAFISLGLPDSLLGAGWSVMHEQLSVPVSYAGIITMLVSIFTIISSLACSKIISKIGSGFFTAISVTLTAIGMVGFSLANNFWILVALTLPYGLGAGGVDATLNNYVALHYKPRHMSWLHCFWGVGAIISPYVMGLGISKFNSWQAGYIVVGCLQGVLAIVLFCTLPLWKKVGKTEKTEENATISLSLKQIFSIKGAPTYLIAFFCYCAVEQTAMIWAGTYLNGYKLLTAENAAFFSSFVFIGLTIGRMISGFITEKLGDKRLIRLGYAITIVGLVLLGIPVKSEIPALIGFCIMGLGFAPIYPCIIHATPDNFGKEKSQAIIGVLMACAYTGVTFMPPLFGLIADYVSVGYLPLFLAVLTATLIASFEIFIAKRKKLTAI